MPGRCDWDGPNGGCTAIPAETMLAPIRRRLRMLLPICHGRCGPTHGCGAQVDRLGDHALACPRSATLSEPKGRCCRNNGLCTIQHPACAWRLDLVIESDPQPLRAVLRCDTYAHGATTGMYGRCRRRRPARSKRRKAATYPSSKAKGRRSSSCLGARSEGASTALATSVDGPPLDRVLDLGEAEGPIAAANLVVVVKCVGLGLPYPLTGHEVGRSKNA